MANTDNRGYVKHTMVGLLALLTTPSPALAKSKFLSLGIYGKPGWFRPAMLALALGITGLAATDPVYADYRRSCRTVLEVVPQESGIRAEFYDFPVYNTVSRYYRVNEARRVIRRAVTSCLRTHWDQRDSESRPVACQSQGSLDFSHYPFDNLAARLRDDLCSANPDVLQMNVTINARIEGERGCVVNGGNINPHTRVHLADSYQINCPARDIGSWICAGCPPSEPPLPNTRLPGNDIGGIWIAGEDWQTCWQMCEDNADCRAWTYRAPGTTWWLEESSARCLLKRAASALVRDNCCQSGIKE